MPTAAKYNDRIYVPIIWVLSVVVPLVVGVLLNPRLELNIDWGFNPYILPRLNAGINSIVSILLLIGFLFIRNKKIDWHRRAMLTAFGFSAVFLVSYVMYHLAVGHTPYCEGGLVSKGFYYTVLISHILLSVTIIPLASFSIYRGLNERFDKHRRLARITFPLWLYVSVTGVLVYFLIAPCYPGA